MTACTFTLPAPLARLAVDSQVLLVPLEPQPVRESGPFAPRGLWYWRHPDLGTVVLAVAPVLHRDADELVALPREQRGRHGAVDPAREGDEHLHVAFRKRVSGFP